MPISLRPVAALGNDLLQGEIGVDLVDPQGTQLQKQG